MNLSPTLFLLLVALWHFSGAPLYAETAGVAKLSHHRVGELRSMRLHSRPMIVPPISFTDRRGNSLNLKDMAGKVVVLNLWATWCVPCVKEMPALDRLQERFTNRDIQVLAISQDRAGNKIVPAYFAKLGLRTIGMYFDNSSSIMTNVRAFGLPTTLVIDPQGREVARLIGAINWDAEEVARFLEAILDHSRGPN
jgi:thiol-disulfide isomerase/thioredoxin